MEFIDQCAKTEGNYRNEVVMLHELEDLDVQVAVPPAAQLAALRLRRLIKADFEYCASPGAAAG